MGSSYVLGITPVALARGLRAYWRFEGTSYAGTAKEILDYSRQGRHGYGMRCTTSALPASDASGKLGRCIGFKDGGASNGADIGCAYDFQMDMELSISAWVKYDAFGHMAVSKCNNDSPAKNVLMGMGITGGSKLSLILETNGGTNRIWVQGNNTGSTGVWYHIVATYDGSQAASGVKLYRNAALQTNTDVQDDAGADILHPDPWRAGCYNNCSWNGDMRVDEVMIWDRILTADEVTAIYNSGTAWVIPV